jgi:excinuclease ABC subunit A
VVAEARANRWLELTGARQHNLKNIDVRVPLKRLVCVTGVSGSGKSTLVEDVLYPALLKYRGKPTEAPGAFGGLRGADLIDDVVMVDQSPIGRSTRSNPASYVGAFDAIRNLFATEPASQERKYTAGTFSFNSGNGRCPTCSGNGFEHVEMQFLSDVYLRCPDCNGKRYRDEVLDIKREGADGREHRGRVGNDGDGSAGVLQGLARSGLAPRALGRRRPGVREARPARADTLGW